MRRPTLLELVLWSCAVAILAGLLTPAKARSPGAGRPWHEQPIQVAAVAFGLSAAAGTALLAAYHVVRRLRSRP
jgi:uncharacterized MAPEG superfamily protein